MQRTNHPSPNDAKWQHVHVVTLVNTQAGAFRDEAIPEAIAYAQDHPSETVVFRFSDVEVEIKPKMLAEDVVREWEEAAEDKATFRRACERSARERQRSR